MKREPSIHITESTLKMLLKRVLGSKKLANKVSKSMFLESYKYSLTSRSLIIPNKTIEAKVKKIVAHSSKDAYTFAMTLNIIRRTKFHHRGIKKMEDTDKDWNTLKKVAADAVEFANQFELVKLEGMKEYIMIGTKMMAKFGINKFVNLFEAIGDQYQGELKLKSDPHPSTPSLKSHIPCLQRIF